MPICLCCCYSLFMLSICRCSWCGYFKFSIWQCRWRAISLPLMLEQNVFLGHPVMIIALLWSLCCDECLVLYSMSIRLLLNCRLPQAMMTCLSLATMTYFRLTTIGKKVAAANLETALCGSAMMIFSLNMCLLFVLLAKKLPCAYISSHISNFLIFPCLMRHDCILFKIVFSLVLVYFWDQLCLSALHAPNKADHIFMQLLFCTINEHMSLSWTYAINDEVVIQIWAYITMPVRCIR